MPRLETWTAPEPRRSSGDAALRRENDRLRRLLLEHGIDPDERPDDPA